MIHTFFFYIDTLFKQSRKGIHLAPIEMLAYPDNTKLCVVKVLRTYICQTKEIRNGQSQLLLGYQSAHHAISKDTLAGWLGDVLHRAGVDTLMYSAHKTRSASTSAAAIKGLPVDVIMRAAGWSAESTFTIGSSRRLHHSTWGSHS